jgi:hypothetical protein
MIGHWTRGATASGLGLAATLLLVVAGCGGQGERVDDAVVTTEPGTAASAPAAAAPGGEAATPESTSTAPAVVDTGATGGYGTLKGQVVFDGDPPTLPPLREKGKAEKDPEFCASMDAIPDQRLVVDPETKGVKFALVYIRQLKGKVNPEVESAAKDAEAEFDQHGCVFEPHVMGLFKGQTLVLKSSDPVGHNVNIKVENNASNIAVPANAALPPTDLKQTSSKPGEVVCDIHPWMKAWWMVNSNPYITVTDEKGNYELKNVPAGTQKVVVWSEAVHPGFVTPGSGEVVAIKADAETEHTFHIKPAQVKVK